MRAIGPLVAHMGLRELSPDKLDLHAGHTRAPQPALTARAASGPVGTRQRCGACLRLVRSAALECAPLRLRTSAARSVGNMRRPPWQPRLQTGHDTKYVQAKPAIAFAVFAVGHRCGARLMGTAKRCSAAENSVTEHPESMWHAAMRSA